MKHARYRILPYTLEATTLAPQELIGRAVSNVLSELEEELGVLDIKTLRVEIAYVPPPPSIGPPLDPCNFGFLEVRGSMGEAA